MTQQISVFTAAVSEQTRDLVMPFLAYEETSVTDYAESTVSGDFCGAGLEEVLQDSYSLHEARARPGGESYWGFPLGNPGFRIPTGDRVRKHGLLIA